MNRSESCETDDTGSGAASGIDRVVLDLRDDPSGATGLVVARQLVRCSPASADLGCDLLGLDETDADALVASVANESWMLGEIPDEVVTIDLRATEPDGRVVIDLTGAPGELSLTSAPSSAADSVLGVLTRTRLDSEPRRLRLHGGAVADPSGRAAVVLGLSGAGKSTLIAHLAHSGLRLINDEQVTLFPDQGVVAGFTRPVAIKPGGTAHLPEVVAATLEETGATMLVTARALGTDHCLSAQPVVTVLPERARDGEDDLPSWELLSPGRAVEALLANNLDLENRPVEGLRAAVWLAEAGPVVRLRYRHAAEACVEVQRLLDEPPARFEERTATVVDHAVGRDLAQLSGVTSGGQTVPPVDYSVSPQVLSVDLGDEVLVYQRATRGVALFNAAGTELWRRLPLEAGLIDPEGLAFVAELVDHGFLIDHSVSTAAVTHQIGDGEFGRAPRLVSRRMRGSVIVFEPSGGFHRLDGATAVVWNHLDSPLSMEDLTEALAAGARDHGEALPEMDALRSEVDRAVAELVVAGLVVSRSAQAASP